VTVTDLSWGVDGSMPPSAFLASAEASALLPPDVAANVTASADRSFDLQACYLQALLWGMLTVSLEFKVLDRKVNQVVATLIFGYIAVAFQAFVIARVTNALARFQARSEEKDKEVLRMSRYMQDLRVPTKLADEVLAFYDFASSKAGTTTDDALPGLPYKLRLQVEIFSKRQIFLQVPLFEEICKASPHVVEELVLQTRWWFATEGRVLLEQGKAPTGLYVISRGSVQLSVKKEELGHQVPEHLDTKYPGECLGEVELFSEWALRRRNERVRKNLERGAQEAQEAPGQADDVSLHSSMQEAKSSCVAAEYCELLFMSREHFLGFLNKYQGDVQTNRIIGMMRRSACQEYTPKPGAQRELGQLREKRRTVKTVRLLSRSSSLLATVRSGRDASIRDASRRDAGRDAACSASCASCW